MSQRCEMIVSSPQGQHRWPRGDLSSRCYGRAVFSQKVSVCKPRGYKVANDGLLEQKSKSNPVITR
jgi:hypothetical protein